MISVDFSPAIDKVENMVSGFIALIPNIIVALVVLGLFLALASVVKVLVKRFAEGTDMPPNAGLILGRLARALIILAGLLFSFPIVFDEFTAGQVVEILGIGGVAIGFAFRDILQNFLAGILILITQPFKIGDQIAVGEFEGTVEDIHTRATLITTYDGRRVVIPNADLFTQAVTVNTAFDIRRSHYDVGIGYGDDVALASNLILEAVRSVPEVVETPEPEALLVELAGSSVNIRARWWTHSWRGDVVAIQAKVIAAIKDRLSQSGIDLPFPTQQILFHDQTEETDGDRSRQREGWPVKPDEQPSKPLRIADALRELRDSRVQASGDR